MKKNHGRCFFVCFFKIHLIECWEGVVDSGVKTWQPEGWSSFSESCRKSVPAPKVRKSPNTGTAVFFCITIIFGVYIYLYHFYLLVFSGLGNKMTCVLCRRPDETENTGTLSSKENVVAHQNCLVNIL